MLDFLGSWPLPWLPSKGQAGKSCGMATTLLSGAWVLRAALSVTYWSHLLRGNIDYLGEAGACLPVTPSQSLHGIHNSLTEQANKPSPH